jgi:DNA-directed RNA polymerase subunit RPC12/RpoP
MKIKCPACGAENYFSGIEDEDDIVCSNCGEPLFKIGKEKSGNMFPESKKILQIAESLDSIAHAGVAKNINFIEKVCKECYKNQKSFSKEIRNSIGLEYMIVFINLIIRIAYDILGEDKTWKLLEELEKIFWEHMSGTINKRNIDDFTISEEKFKIYLKTRFNEYNEYKLFNGKDGNPKGTLFWEFGKNISKISGHPYDIRIVTAGSTGAFAFAGERQELEKIINQII